jgi:serine/threonine protein kinase
MEDELFFERYRICRNPDGKPEEAARTGAAISYKAVDAQSKEPVLLQLVPLAAIDPTRRDEFETRAKAVREVDHVNVARVLEAGVQHGYFAFVTEYLSGETTDRWIVAHGTMTLDTVLRIGIQVVMATAAAAFYGLIHRAIQPSNIIILPGEAPTGGWPFIKVLNFGGAALELHGESNDARELAPAVVPQFASPEQVRNQQIDFRSEMYSLGATMCFLLTGAVPLPRADEASVARRGRRRLPELKSMPKPVRRLLGSMLAENSEDRPLDPVALERYMITILGIIERRQAWGRKLGIPLATSVPRKIVRSPSPFAQVVRGGLVFAALLIALAAIGAVLYPKYFHHSRSVEEIGVPVGVPVAEQTNVAPPVTTGPNIGSGARSTGSPKPQIKTPAVAQAFPASSASPVQNISPSGPSAPVTGESQTVQSASSLANIDSTQQSPASDTANSPAVTQNTRTDNSTEPPKTTTRTTPFAGTVADAKAEAPTNRYREPEPPSAGPDDEDAASTTRPKYSDETQPRVTARSRTNPIARDDAQFRPRRSDRWAHAIFIGTTPMGKLLFRLPSGRIIAMNPRHRREPAAIRPRPYPPQPYYGPPPYGYPPPGYDY